MEPLERIQYSKWSACGKPGGVFRRGWTKIRKMRVFNKKTEAELAAGRKAAAYKYLRSKGVPTRADMFLKNWGKRVALKELAAMQSAEARHDSWWSSYAKTARPFHEWELCSKRNPILFLQCYAFIAKEAKRQRKALGRQQLRRNPNCKTFIVERIRKRMARSIKDGKGMKSGASREIIGCDWDTLRAHLASGFVNGMSWDNYGQYGWHIDHKVPLSRFDMRDPAQVKEAWNYKNLQPLWWTDNLDKLARLDWEPKSPANAHSLALAAI